jgi:hypothetical protein
MGFASGIEVVQLSRSCGQFGLGCIADLFRAFIECALFRCEHFGRQHFLIYFLSF